MVDLLSKRILKQLSEYFVGTSLREISEAFDAAGIACHEEHEPEVKGQRRRLVARYYHSLNFSDAGDVKKWLAVYATAIRALEAQVEAGQPQRIPQVNLLKKRLKKEGYVFDKGRVTPKV